MFQVYLAAALCIVLASVSQIQAAAGGGGAGGAAATVGTVCSTAWLPPSANNKGNLCIGPDGFKTCARAGVESDYDRKAPTGKGCTFNGAPVDKPVCTGGFQRRGQLYECYQKVGSREYTRCTSVESMYGAGGECDKKIGGIP